MTPAGAIQLERYGLMDRKTLEMLMLSALRKKNFTHAVDLAFTYGCRSAPSIPTGLEIWARDVRRLDLIFANKPALLASVPEDVLEQLRLVAGLWHLLGKDEPLQAVRPANGHVPGTHIGSRWAPNMLLLHADFLATMETLWERSGQRPGLYITVRNVGDEFVCRSCRELAMMRFRLGDDFELPNPLCTCKMGCRCHAHPGIY